MVIPMTYVFHSRIPNGLVSRRLNVMRDILQIFIFYFIQRIESENMMNVPDYSVEVIIAAF